MQLKKWLAAALCCALMGGCMPLETNVENLMQPPTLTQLQTQVDHALRNAVGGDFTLKYPESGSYRSGYNFIDLDGDGTEEAIAFVQPKGEDILRIALLRQSNGAWYVSDLVPGQSFFTEVDFVAVQTLGSLTRLAVGLGSTGRENHLLTLYDCTSVLTVDSRWDYSRASVVDMNLDGKNELLLLLVADGYDIADPMAQLVGESKQGIVDLLAEATLPRNLVAFFPPVAGLLDDTLYGVAADCLLSNGKLCTITIAYSEGALQLPLTAEENQTAFRATIRSQQVLSCDINGDGRVDIPLERIAEGYRENSSDALYFIDYSNFTAEEPHMVQSAYVDLTRGYRLLLPAQWGEHPVSAVRLPETNETVFFINSGGNLYDHSKELLRIKVYSTVEEQERIAQERYFQLATKGSYLYAAALPANPLEGLRLTANEVQQLFTLL